VNSEPVIKRAELAEDAIDGVCLGPVWVIEGKDVSFE